MPIHIAAAPGEEYVVDNDPLQDARNEKAARRQAALNAGVTPSPQDSEASTTIVIPQGSLVLKVEGPDDDATVATIHQLNSDAKEAGADAEISTALNPSGYAFIQARSKRLPSSLDDRLAQALVGATNLLPVLRQEHAKDATRSDASILELSLRHQYALRAKAINALIAERSWRNIRARTDI